MVCSCARAVACLASGKRGRSKEAFLASPCFSFCDLVVGIHLLCFFLYPDRIAVPDYFCPHRIDRPDYRDYKGTPRASVRLPHYRIIH